jgi:hypothetical protein
LLEQPDEFGAAVADPSPTIDLRDARYTTSTDATARFAARFEESPWLTPAVRLVRGKVIVVHRTLHDVLSGVKLRRFMVVVRW